MNRSIIGVVLSISFLVLACSGLYAFLFGYWTTNVFIHVTFGWMFIVIVLLHLAKNIKPFSRYLKRPTSWVLPAFLLLLILGTFTSFHPIQKLSNYYQIHKSSLPREIEQEYYVYELGQGSNLEIEVLEGNHFWFPQLAIWTEDTLGNYLESLMVTYSTASGTFYSGRTKDNFRSLDKSVNLSTTSIRVDALPYWSHKRGVRYNDGYYSPHPDEPMPDGITGATPQGSFKVKTSYDSMEVFHVLLEVNVAFDDNEYFSEFDFADDSLFHSGAGLLGQPSLIYKAEVSRDENRKYFLMKLIGHGHHSGQDGKLYSDLSSITTAREILDRIIIKYE